MSDNETMRLLVALEHRCRARDIRRRAIDSAREGEIISSWWLLQQAAYQEIWAQALDSGDPARRPNGIELAIPRFRSG